ncbi:hypothetical protein D3C71_1783760 [compost metagenome]
MYASATAYPMENRVHFQEAVSFLITPTVARQGVYSRMKTMKLTELSGVNIWEISAFRLAPSWVL